MPLELKRRKGSKLWYLRGTVRGITVFETTGTDNKAAAEAIKIQRESRLLKDSIYGKQASVTFAEAAVSYLDNGGSARYLGEQKDGRWTGLIGHFYSTPLHKIGQDELNQAALKLYPNTNPETRNRQCFTPFIAVWNHAVTNKWAEMRKWRRPKRAKGTMVLQTKTRAGTTPVSYERAAKFVLAMSPAPAMLMTTLFYTGMRPIEAFALEASAIDIEGRWISLGATKTGEPRGVPIHEFLVPLLTPLATREGRVFLTPQGNPYPVEEAVAGQIKTAINSARKRTGIPEISPYTARHTVSTQLVMNGVHPHLKDQILGHAVTDMSRHYTNVPQADLIAAINTLPVVAAWGVVGWMTDPLAWAKKYAGNRGKRNDLVKGAA